MSQENIGLLLFVFMFLIILSGYPVAFVLGGLSAIIGIIFVPDFLDFLPLRIMGVVQNYVLLAVPLFVYMGLVLEKSGIAEELLQSMAHLFGNIKGGLAISVVVVGTLLAASTGIVGATVIAMGLISLPVMLAQGYDKGIATGIIASSGTLGQIIPPSVVLVLLGSVLNVPVGDLFRSAVVPGLLLVFMYLLYILIIGRIRPSTMPLAKDLYSGEQPYISTAILFKSFAYPLILILAVLGAIFSGIASPTEAAGVGAAGAVILALLRKKMTFTLLTDVSKETLHITSMVFIILLGATTFSLVFRGMGGDKLLIAMIQNSQMSAHLFIAVVMLVVFIAGFFIDFIEIIFIIVPVIAPLLVSYQIDLIWIGILLALNLQTSFLTPPFGFALFYLKGVAPQEVRTEDIYKGVIPFLIIQIFVLLLCFFIPDMTKIL